MCHEDLCDWYDWSNCCDPADQVCKDGYHDDHCGEYGEQCEDCGGWTCDSSSRTCQ
jgi:hypothetical protein